MPLAAGTRLGPYEVLGPLGAGGMGEVYRARDARLGRDVAIKSLPDLSLSDPDRVARFQREAQILASLSHPHIAAIYGLEESSGRQFLVLELVEGGTLSERLKTGPVAVAETLAFARQVALALEAAHDKGIIHRDLKPGNIAVTASGQVKVLDFGLAKALAPAGSETVDAADRSTVLADATASGVILGTTGYMSPEQARGKTLDRRTDIWAFGCVLYEMLAGRSPFPGRTFSDTIAAILEREPDWKALPASTPSRVVWLVRRCLEKDADRRLHDIADARIEIDEALRAPADGIAVGGPPTGAGRAKTRETIAWIAAGASLVGLVAVWAVNRGAGDGSGSAPSTYTASIRLPDDLRLGTANSPGRFALSPDGRRLAVVATDASGRTLIWVRPLETSAAQALTGTDGASFPFWSPDSRSLAFIADDKLKRIDLAGGTPTTIADADMSSTGTWNQDGVILFTPKGGSPIYRVSAAGGTPVQATTLDAAEGEAQHWYPFFLPDGRHFLYFAVGSKAGGLTDARAVLVGSIDSTKPAKLLVKGGSNAKYASGHLVFSREGTLVAQRFDVDRLELVGEPVPLVEKVQIAGLTGTAGAFTVSATGVLAYQTGSVFRSRLAWFDRRGTQTSTLGELADYSDVMLSPDGASAAVSALDPIVGTRDLWVFDLARGIRERLTSDPGDDFAPIWSRQDGSRISYSSKRGGGIHLYQRPARGAGAETLLWEDALGKFASDWSADGKYLVYIGGGGIIMRSDLWILPLAAGAKAYPLLEARYVESHGQFSPDGRWLAYMSMETGRAEVYVTAFADPGNRRQVSTAGGGWPRWRRDGAELFYLAADNTFTAVAVNGRGLKFEVGASERLFNVRPRPFARLDAFPYDVTSDGRRFLINTFVDEPMAAPITLVVNWPGTLKK